MPGRTRTRWVVSTSRSGATLSGVRWTPSRRTSTSRVSPGRRLRMPFWRSRLPGDTRDVEVLLEGVHLTPESVAPDRDVETTQRVLVRPGIRDPVGQHDHAGARPVHRHTVGNSLAQRLLQVERANQLVHGGRLTTWDHQRVDVVELVRAAYADDLRTQRRQGVHVFPHIPLNGQDAYAESGIAHAPRVCGSVTAHVAGPVARG